MWDTVTVKGTAAAAAGMCDDLDGEKVLYDAGADWLMVRITPGGEHFYGRLLQTGTSAVWSSLDGKSSLTYSSEEPLQCERRVPDLDYLTECDNRVWGCSGSENVIYACKLGDPTNWFSYRNTAADSYAVTVGSDGDFTGAAACMGYVLFFQGEHPPQAGAGQSPRTSSSAACGAAEWPGTRLKASASSTRRCIISRRKG